MAKEKSKFEKQVYLERVQAKLHNFRKAALELTEIWDHDKENDINLNELMCEDFPFNISFDEMAAEISKWTQSAQRNLINENRKLISE